MTRSLSGVSVPDLESLRRAIESQRVRFPLTRSGLQAAGLGDAAEPLAAALDGLDEPAAARVVELLLAERRDRQHPDLDLVWTGPEPAHARSRDTAVVVRQLFASAQRSVLVGGYSFDHGEEILAPLHEAMKDRGVEVSLFLDIEGVASSADEADAYATARVDEFLRRNWPFGPPLPAIYYDPRTVRPDPYTSLHAKCVVVDERRTLVTSANFTSRGHSRNVELGVLIDDPPFAHRVVAHWKHLAATGLMVRYRG